MTTDIRIKGLQEISGRWFWTVVNEYGESNRYYTSNRGEGIFTDNDNQMTGLCQFNLNGVSRSTRLRRIRAFFAN